MNKKMNFLTSRVIGYSTWIKKGLILLLVSFLANHLMERDNFPFSDSYGFPLFPIFTSLIVGGMILLITELNFRYFERKYFTNEINTKTLAFFLLSTLGYITILYIPSFYLVVWIQDGDFGFYYLLVGLSITLLLSTLAIFALYAHKLYKLKQMEALTGKLVIRRGKNKTLVNISKIAYFYSKNKVVYAVQSDGQTISTDFSLNDIEDKMRQYSFIRANRQTLAHSRSVSEIKVIENGKLSIDLEPVMFNQDSMKIVVSRYKKKEFNEWFKNISSI